MEAVVRYQFKVLNLSLFCVRRNNYFSTLTLPSVISGGRACCRRFSVSGWLTSSGSNPTAGSDLEPPNGIVYDKKPVRLVLDAGKLYSWCTCGYSMKQPFCDGSHKAVNDSPDADRSKPPFRSHKFQVDETKEFSLCNCKQTNKRPFCDGAHKQKWIQEANVTA